jgi:DNA-binding NarL/FixJ family response regulator
MRIVLAEDSVVFREGLTRLLAEAGHQVVGCRGAARRRPRDPARPGHRRRPDAAHDERRPRPRGAAAAYRAPGLPIVPLSQHVEIRHAVQLVATGSSGYLLKDRR